MSKEDNVFFAKRKLVDNIYKSAVLEGIRVTIEDVYAFMQNVNTGTIQHPKLPSECDYDSELKSILSISNSLERCITLFCFIQRSQMFLDGNMRVANLVANKEMIRNGEGILSVPVEKIGEYFTYLIHYYETGDMTEIKNFLYQNCIDGVE